MSIWTISYGPNNSFQLLYNLMLHILCRLNARKKQFFTGANNLKMIKFDKNIWCDYATYFFLNKC